jgi:alanine racemase
MSPPRARLTIDLDALAANYAFMRVQAGSAEVAPVVKADGYSLGAAPIAKRLWREGARTFFVASLVEGEALRAALGPKRPSMILVFEGAPPESAARLAASGLCPVLNSLAQVDHYAAFCRGNGGGPPCALHIDTGMNRLGLRSEDMEALAASSDRLQGLQVSWVMSHLACADQVRHPMNARQMEGFRQVRTLFPHARASLANSAGLFLGQDYRYDMVRPGISLYGGGPFGQTHPSLQTVVTLQAPILDVRAVAAGETVGYGADYRAECDCRVAIVAAGYADGVPRLGPNTGEAWFAGQRRRLLGRVSMDLLAIDVTGCDAALPGAMVELLGAHASLDDVAASAGTIAHDILTGLGRRAERVYLDAE